MESESVWAVPGSPTMIEPCDLLIVNRRTPAMRPYPRLLNPLRHLAAVLLLGGMVFQLGACACGCVEHNLWAQLLGLHAEDDHHHDSAFPENDGGESALAAEDSHECSGQPKAPFVDNARTPRAQDALLPGTLDGAVAVAALSSPTIPLLAARRVARPPNSAYRAALCRPALQVYRL